MMPKTNTPPIHLWTGLNPLLSAIASTIFLSISPRCESATITLSIGLGDVLDHQGQQISTDSLFQLVKLGLDGDFNPIPAGSWVGGDDTLVALSFPNSDGWTTAAAFDLTDGIGNAGEFTRQFTFTLDASLATGDKLGIRWFPTLRAVDFPAALTLGGLPYGQFTRQNTPLYGGNTWVVPAGGDLVTLDPLVTASYDPVGGLDANVSGRATHVVVPEANTFGLCLTAWLWLLRRRRGPSVDTRGPAN